MGRTAALLAIGLAACGRFGFDDGGGRDAGADDSSDVMTGPAVRIQRGTVTMPISQLSLGVPIEVIDLAHAWLVFGVAVNTLSPSEGIIGAALGTSAITFERASGTVAATITYEVIESAELFDVQHGSLPKPDATTFDTTVTINAVDTTRSFVVSWVSNGGTGYDEDDYVRSSLANPTTVALHAGAPAGSGRMPALTSYEVVSVSEASTKRGQGTLAALIGSTGQSFLPTIDPAHAVALLSMSCEADDGDIGSVALAAELFAGSIGITRDIGTLDITYAWQMIESPRFSVIHGSSAFAAGDTLRTEPVDVDVARSFVLSAGAKTPFSGVDPNDRAGITGFRTELVPGGLVVERGDGTEAAEVFWAVVSL